MSGLIYHFMKDKPEFDMGPTLFSLQWKEELISNIFILLYHQTKCTVTLGVSLCTTGHQVLPRGPRGLCLNWPLLWASWMALRSVGMCSPKRRRRLDRLLSIVCRFLLMASMDLWSTSCSLLKTEGAGCFHYVRDCYCFSYSTAVRILQANTSSPNWVYLRLEGS